MKWCVNCFRQYDDQFSLCPYCGEEEATRPKEPVHLRPGTELYDGRYVIGLSVGSGGFGVVYRAWDKNLRTVVAIKEFYMSQIMVRAEGDDRIAVYKSKVEQYEYNKRRFLAEARAMAKFGGTANIPKVYDFFEDNNTAYISMELFTGTSLRQYLNQRPGRRVDPEFAVYVATEVAKSLKVMHENNVIHRDIAPDNIFYTESDQGEPKIDVIDLGTARLADDTDARLQIETKPGYTPVEQYDHAQKDIGPWTDIYALGATLYNMLTGIRPEESTNRKRALENREPDPVRSPHEVDLSIPVDLSNAVMRAMAVDRNLRLDNMDDFIRAINGRKKVRNPVDERKVRRRRQVFGIAAALLVLALVGLSVGGLFVKESKEAFLDPAGISIWIPAEEGSDKEAAILAIARDFMDKYPNVRVDVRAIDSAAYAEEIEAAAREDRLPDLFESTGLPDEVLVNARSLSNVLSSEQAQDCLFLDQYAQYYASDKRIPLGIEAPMAYVITSGAVRLPYSAATFRSLSDFGAGTAISLDEKARPLVIRNFGEGAYGPEADFFAEDGNRSAVLLSSTMEINRVRESLTQYSKAFVFYDGDRICCRFTYEWSIGAADGDKLAAAERLLSWMLGNVYQNYAMISLCSEGQIPINRECFRAKISSQYLQPVSDIYTKFVFERLNGK